MSIWSKIERAAGTSVHWVEGAAKDTGHWVEGAANDTGHWVEGAAEDTAEWVEGAAQDTAEWVEGAADVTARGFNDVGIGVGRALADAWRSTSRETAAFADAVENAGITVSDAVLEGVVTVSEVLEDAAEVVAEEAVATVTYLSQHACEIGIGSALAAAFAALAADGEEEAATGGLAVVCALELVDNAALKSAAEALAYVVIEPVYAIPGVREALGYKSEAHALVAFLVFKACKQNPKCVIGTAGQFLVAVLIWGVTQLVCSGRLTGLDIGWSGLQHEITG